MQDPYFDVKAHAVDGTCAFACLRVEFMAPIGALSSGADLFAGFIHAFREKIHGLLQNGLIEKEVFLLCLFKGYRTKCVLQLVWN